VSDDEISPPPPSGLYRLHWKEGGASLASVGRDRYGRVWFAPTNWIKVPWYDWELVASVERIEVPTDQPEPVAVSGP
jgi:hypothetical protein